MEREKSNRPSYADVRREMVKAVLDVRRHPADDKRFATAKQVTAKWAKMAHQNADKALLEVCGWLLSDGAPEEIDIYAYDGRHIDEALAREEFRRQAAQHQTWLRKGMDRLPPEEWAQLRNDGVVAAQMFVQTAATAALVAAGCAHTLDLLVRSACVGGLGIARQQLRLGTEGGASEMYAAIEAYVLRSASGGSGDRQLGDLMWEAMVGSQQVYFGEVGDLAIQRLEAAYGVLTDAEVLQLAAEEPARQEALRAALAAEEEAKKARQEKRRAAKRKALEKARRLEEAAAAKAAARAEEEAEAAEEPAVEVPSEEAKLIKALQCHDWYYAYSDDHRVWSNGDAHRKEIEAMVSALGVRGAELWNEHKPDRIGAKYVPKAKVEEPPIAPSPVLDVLEPGTPISDAVRETIRETHAVLDELGAEKPPWLPPLPEEPAAAQEPEVYTTGVTLGEVTTAMVVPEPRFEVVLKSWNGVEWVFHTSYLKPGETLDLTGTGWQIVSQGWTS